MGTTIARIQRAGYRLIKAYSSGNTVYPRVDADYNRYKAYDFFPHPPLDRFDEHAFPLRYKRYPFIKDAMPVELSNYKIATASTVEGIIKWLDRYYDDDMKPRGKKEEREISKKLDNFYDHLERLSKQYGEQTLKDESGRFDVDKIAKDGLASRMKMPIETFSFRRRLVPGKESDAKLLAQIKNAEKERKRQAKRRESKRNFAGLKPPKRVKSISEAVSFFFLFRFGPMYLARKSQLLMRRLFVNR